MAFLPSYEVILGQPALQSIQVATTANITLSGVQSIDGVGVAVGDRVLVKNQTTVLDNGIYTASNGAWTRSYDMQQNATIPNGLLVYVKLGTAGGNRLWALKRNVQAAQTMVVGVDQLSFTSVAFS